MSSALVNNKDRLPREARKTTDTTFDRIYKFYHNDKTRIELSEEEKVIAERWEKAWFLLCGHKPVKKVCDELESMFSISKQLAYNDVRNAMMLFEDPRHNFKEAKRAISETSLLNGAAKAWEDGDLEMHLKYMKEYNEINGLKTPDSENAIADFVKKMKPQQIIIVANQKDLEAEANRLQEELTQEVEFKEVQE